MNVCTKCQRSSSGRCCDISYQIRNVSHMVAFRKKSQDHKSPTVHPLGTVNRTMMNLLRYLAWLNIRTDMKQ